MEFLMMADEMLNSSFLDDAGDAGELEWGAWPPEERSDVSALIQLSSRKRRAATEQSLGESSCKDSGYKANRVGTPSGSRIKQPRNKCAERERSGPNSWQSGVDELTGNLADDLDGTCSLTGLGVDLNQSSYNNISEALLTLPSLTVFKQELPSPGNNQDINGSVLPYTNGCNGNSNGGHLSPPMLVHCDNNCSSSTTQLSNNNSSASNSPPHLHQMLSYNSADDQKKKIPVPIALVVPDNVISSTLTNDNNNTSKNNNEIKVKVQQEENGAVHNNSGSASINNNSVVTSSSSLSPTSSEHCGEDCRFQYVLAAATSIATKVNEETQTYLNQGQSYEIKLKKLGDLSNYRGKILKSVVRLSFHERRLQYMESEQMAAWVNSHPSLRIMEVDLPLSYGIVDVLQDGTLLNNVEFLWDPTKEVGVYIKVNCISTEFTPNKHGGEKGVPFRIQVETFLHGQSTPRRLHTASCQIKVFKLKGADRKHKQDKEKILKRPRNEQEKYQPSYECTVLNDMPNDADPIHSPMPVPSNQPVMATAAVQPTDNIRGSAVEQRSPLRAAVSSANPEQPISSQAQQLQCVQPTTGLVQQTLPLDTSANNNFESALSRSATVQQATAWLLGNRFSSFLRTFSNFSGLDLLRLSCDNLIQICGLPEGIRLFNALHRSPLMPRLTLYLCVDPSIEVYHALYLDSLTSVELREKLSVLLNSSVSQIDNILMQGPAGIHVVVSDDVIHNLKDESIYTVEILQGQVDHYCLLLKPSTRCH